MYTLTPSTAKDRHSVSFNLTVVFVQADLTVTKAEQEAGIQAGD